MPNTRSGNRINVSTGIANINSGQFRSITMQAGLPRTNQLGMKYTF